MFRFFKERHPPLPSPFFVAKFVANAEKNNMNTVEALISRHLLDTKNVFTYVTGAGRLQASGQYISKVYMPPRKRFPS